MFKGLHARLTLIFILAASSILVIAGLIMMYEVHFHFTMFQKDVPEFNSIEPLTHHFEKALLSSVLWTSLGAILLVCIISYFVAKNLSRPMVEMRKAAEKMAKGELQVRVKSLGDDELNDLGNSLNQLASKLQLQETYRKNMTSDIAHELRTPLATIKSHLEAFEDGVFEPTTARIQSLTGEIDRLITIVQDLEYLTAMEAPEFSLNKKPQQLNHILIKSVNAVSGAFVQNGILLRSELDSDIEINMDAKRMSQVFMNLFSNALRYTPRGGEVTVVTHVDTKSVLISIRDTGIGIPEEESKHVFERFYRGEKSRNREYGGSGIGLTIVKRIVEAHDGQIWINEEYKQGTEVKMKFFR
ncbi:HAMP domain-containing sensor histidine kinase [Fictibacillus norfolkensis]|uniref:histidine kinase n=1 Tax=Fictibacillus norfolkensis TaxID=2762233 RepID=A0ABR8SPX7_9BACL|nr:ATP-binding protein [Fictibacillus norfolkensis]MBD7965449.1 HAMP domain-containing protein [Fictibacillus norfolkensis]